MNKALPLVVISSLFLVQAHAAQGYRAIYGEDNRREVYESSPAHQLLAKSTAVMVAKSKIKPLYSRFRSTSMTLRQTTLGGDYSQLISILGSGSLPFRAKSCSDVKFRDQPRPAECSGFLIAPDLMVTAGHCVMTEKFCEDYKWVFDFKLDKDTQTAGVNMNADSIYSCKKVISYTRTDIDDYGVFQLDRKVTGRAPLKVRSEGLVAPDQKIFVIGSPMGLPIKVATDATVTENNSKQYFVTDLDTFSGNSGSAVFNADTEVVEGILVRGSEDYSFNPEKLCMEETICDEEKCSGEEVSRLTSIPEVKYQSDLYKAATSGDVSLIKEIAAKKVWIDFYTIDGQSALMKAGVVGQESSVKELLKLDANVSLQDAKGNTAVHLIAEVMTPLHVSIVSTLISSGLDLEARNDKGDTALLGAAKKINLVAVKELIKLGAKKNAEDSKGENIAFPFVRAGDVEAVLELKKLGVNTKSAMKVATTKTKIRMVLKSL